ncbi:MAG: alpha/beta hydrolase [Oscillospiraceae bacterium]|nr:alpha/beta hydrolase [Oscillospiraceae bacterium]
MKLSIDRKEQVLLGGLKQTIHIWGSKPENPVLLFLHGGPGVPNRHGMAKNHMDLTDDFTIVAWDQRGTGGSYFGCDPASLTLDQLVSDCAQLIDYLCDTLNKKKLFLLGGSWGTELGTIVCQKHPEKIAGYIGYGQVVNGIENENVSYAFALEKAKAAGNAEDVAELERIGPPVDGQYKPVFEGLMTQRRIMKKYGGHSTKKGGYFSGTVIPILTSPELDLRSKIGTAKG